MLHLVPEGHPLLRLALADGAATIVVFGFSVALDNSSAYDPYWSLMPIAALVFYLWPRGLEGVGPRAWLVAGLTLFWGARLTHNWLRGWKGLGHEDWRYADFRAAWGRLYWPGSFVGIHLVPSVCTFLGSLALYPALASSAPLSLVDAAAFVVTLGAILLETVADAELRRFRAQARASGVDGSICTSGLWAWSRHPNYLGEIGFWVGLWLFGVAAQPSLWWIAAGPVTMIALFLGISIPLAERHSLRRRPDYARVQARISRLLLWPPGPAR